MIVMGVSECIYESIAGKENYDVLEVLDIASFILSFLLSFFLTFFLSFLQHKVIPGLFLLLLFLLT